MSSGITIQPQKAAEAAKPSPEPGVAIKQEKLDEPDLLQPANIKVGVEFFFRALYMQKVGDSCYDYDAKNQFFF